MKEEVKKLITAGMLSDVLGRKIEYIGSESTAKIISFGVEFYWQDSVSIYELKDKLIQYLKNMGELMILHESPESCRITFDDYASIWLELRGETDTEALLKLYHAVKAKDE